jgi:hypothetical protein
MTVRYSRHADLRLTAVEGEGIVLQLGTRRYYTVNETGLVILEALAVPCTSDELVAALLERYDVTRDQAAASVNTFLDRGIAARLIVEQDGS